jgi:hypothetical protein
LDIGRFLADPVDDIVASFVRAITPIDDARTSTRAELSPQGCETLLAFSHRRSASALRDDAVEQAHDAIDAISLVSGALVDPRDVDVDFPLYAAHRSGGDVEAIVERAIANSEPRIAASFKARRGRASRVTLRDCGLMEVQSRFGLGFIDTWSVSYQPHADLVGAAIRMADRIDAGRRYQVDNVHLSTLPAVWFGGESHADVPTTGCVTLDATLAGVPQGPGSQMLLTFVAEVASARTAGRLADRAVSASAADRPVTAAAIDAVLLVLIGDSFMWGEPATETTASLERLRDELLADLEVA